jgi:hypothetical protein
VKNLRVTATAGTPLALVLVLALAQVAHAQMRPPSITFMSRHGLPRGSTTAVTLIGSNLTGADAVLFDDPRITARILHIADQALETPRQAPGSTAAPIKDIAHKCEMDIEIIVPPDVETGTHLLRVRTPLGTTALRTFAVGYLNEVDEAEPNDTADTAQPLTLPVTVNGKLWEPGDVDYYRFTANAGQQLVMAVDAQSLGGRMDSVLELTDESGAQIARNDDRSWQSRDSRLIHTFAKSGTYILKVSDTLGGGNAGRSNDFYYRLTIGELPVITSVFPLGGPSNTPFALSLEGANLGLGKGAGAGKATSKTTMTVRVSTTRQTDRVKTTPRAPAAEARATAAANAAETSFQTAAQTDTRRLRLRAANGLPFNEQRVASDIYPEIVANRVLTGSATGQRIVTPVTINGRIDRRKDGSSADTFRFHARKGQKLVFAVAAERLGSPLDSVIEILDARGHRIPRAIVRPTWETAVDLRDNPSGQQSIRLLSTSGLHRGDYIFVDRELMQVRELPKGPDEDIQLMSFLGRRFSFEGTSGEGHANTRPVYRVELHPPATKLSPNGLPVFELTERNDDGGPLYGKDSYLDFTAPANGEYLVRIADARGQSGRAYAYRLTIAPPRPDFTVSVNPANPNVSRGSRVPVTVFAYRHDGFDEPINVRLDALPSGIEATTAVILPGHNSTVLTLSASETAPAISGSFQVVAQARINGKLVTRNADLTRSVPTVTTTAPPDVRVVSVEPNVIELEPGKRATVHVAIARANGFAGRVPLNVLNLPFRLTIPNTGLNGILITEQQDARDFVIEADSAAQPLEQTLYVTARAEVNSGEQNAQASAPITLHVVSSSPVPTASAARPATTPTSGPPK